MKKWHCGVRAKSSGRLLAFISAIPSTIRVYDKVRRFIIMAQKEGLFLFVWLYFPFFVFLRVLKVRLSLQIF